MKTMQPILRTFITTGSLTNGVIDPISDETIDSDLNAFIDEKCKKYLRDKGIDW